MMTTPVPRQLSGWIQATIGDVTSDSIDQSGAATGHSFVYVDIGSIDTKTKRIQTPKTITPDYVPSRARQRLQPFDVLVSMTRPNLNAVALVGEELAGSVGSTGFCVLRSSVIAPKWLFYIVQTSTFINAMTALVQGALYPAVRPRDVRNFPVPLAPLAEQARIVEAIETQFSRLDAATAALERARANLKRYRAAVLNAACSGRLVPNDEAFLATQSQHLSIEQLASKEPRSIQSGPFGSALLHSEFVDHGMLAIGIDNVQNGSFSLGRQHRISEEKFQQLSKFQARPGDVLITVMATIGRCCVVPDEIEPSIITKHVYRISVDRKKVHPRFLMYSLMGSRPVRTQLFGEVKGQTRPGINGEILRRLIVPVPPLAEQERIVAEVERRLSVVERMETEIAAGLKRAERLRQSILHRAFTGRLVPQDPNDEPAAVLLDRIRADRANLPAPSRVRRPRGS